MWPRHLYQDQDQDTKWKTLFTWSRNRYRKSGMVGLFRLLPVEYDSIVDVVHNVVIQLFGSTSTIHSTSIGKRLPQTLNWSPRWWLLYESFTTLDIFIKTKTNTMGGKTKNKAKTLKMRLETVSRARHISWDFSSLLLWQFVVCNCNDFRSF